MHYKCFPFYQYHSNHTSQQQRIRLAPSKRYFSQNCFQMIPHKKRVGSRLDLSIHPRYWPVELPPIKTWWMASSSFCVRYSVAGWEAATRRGGGAKDVEIIYSSNLHSVDTFYHHLALPLQGKWYRNTSNRFRRARAPRLVVVVVLAVPAGLPYTFLTVGTGCPKLASSVDREILCWQQLAN